MTTTTIGSGREANGLYFLDIPTPTQGQLSVAHHTSISPSAEETIWLWHRRLGHPSFHLIQHLFPSLLPNSSISLFQCESCELSKHYRVHFLISSTKTNVLFSIVHSDAWSPSRIVTLTGHKWFVTFIDDFSRTTWVYLLKEKREMCHVFQIFHKMIHTQFGTEIKILWSDNMKECDNSGLSSYLASNGIIH